MVYPMGMGTPRDEALVCIIRKDACLEKSLNCGCLDRVWGYRSSPEPFIVTQLYLLQAHPVRENLLAYNFFPASYRICG